MKTGRWFLTFFLMTALGLFSLCNAGTAQERPIKLTYANIFPPNHIQSKLAESWAKEIERCSRGKVIIRYYAAGSLLKATQIYEGVLRGITDIGMSAFLYTKDKFPAMEAYHLPLGYKSSKANTFIINDFYNEFRPQEFSEVKVMYLHSNGPSLLHSKDAISKLRDLKGLKIRSSGTIALETKALGAIPVKMGISDVYEAMQKGVVDAQFGPMEILKSFRQAEVIRYSLECYSVSYSNGFYVFMNLDKWNSLPRDVQEAFNLVSCKWIDKHAEAWNNSDLEGRKFSLKLGNKIIPLSETESARWAKAVEPIINEYIENMREKELPAKDYVDYIKELIKKYAE